MIKKDIPIVTEFLGTTDVNCMVTPLKCVRIYSKKDDTNKFIAILTPMLSKDNDMLNLIIKNYSKYNNGNKINPIEYERGKNKVYVFE